MADDDATSVHVNTTLPPDQATPAQRRRVLHLTLAAGSIGHTLTHSAANQITTAYGVASNDVNREERIVEPLKHMPPDMPCDMQKMFMDCAAVQRAIDICGRQLTLCSEATKREDTSSIPTCRVDILVKFPGQDEPIAAALVEFTVDQRLAVYDDIIKIGCMSMGFAECVMGSFWYEHVDAEMKAKDRATNDRPDPPPMVPMAYILAVLETVRMISVLTASRHKEWAALLMDPETLVKAAAISPECLAQRTQTIKYVWSLLNSWGLQGDDVTPQQAVSLLNEKMEIGIANIKNVGDKLSNWFPWYGKHMLSVSASE